MKRSNRSSSAKGFAAIGSGTEEDMNKAKRVRFKDPNADHCINVKPGATSMLRDADKMARSDAPKTSEFAFFKKIKEKGYSRSYQHKEDNQEKDVKPRESRIETTTMFDQSRSYLRPSSSIGKVRIINQDCFPSPLDNESNDSGLNYVVPPCKNISPSLPDNKVKPGGHGWFSPSFGDRSRNSGNQYSEKGVFYGKRQKLRQWVADSSLPEVDDLCFKGLGKTPYCRNRKSREVVNDIEHQQTILPDPDTHVKRLCKTHTPNINVSVHVPYIDNVFAEKWSSLRMDRVIPKLDIIGSDSPSASYAARTPIGYSYRRSLCNEDHNRITSFWRENDSSFHESFEGYGSTPSSHLKELDLMLDYYQPESRVQAHNLLLSWDVNCGKQVQYIAASPFNTDVRSFPMLETLWGDDKEQLVHGEPMSLSPLLKNSDNFPILPNYHLDSFSGDDFRSSIDIEDEKYEGAITLPSTPKYLKLVEDFIHDNTLESSRFEPCPQTYARGDRYCSLEPILFPTRLDFASGLKFLAMTDSFEEHRFTNDASWYLLKDGPWSPSLRKDDTEDFVYNHLSEGTSTGHDWSVSNFKLSPDDDTGQTACSLLLHDSSWDFHEKGTYSKDKDDEWKYV